MALPFFRILVCEFCESLADHWCQNCDEDLCTKCKEDHEENKADHKCMPFCEKARMTCTRHTDRNYISWCSTCREAFCLICTITSYKGHDLIEIQEAINKKKGNLRIQLDGPYEESLSKWKRSHQTARHIANEYLTNIRDVDDALVAHANQIHAAVERSLLNVRRELMEISRSTRAKLTTQEREIGNSYQEFQRIVGKLDVLQQKNDITILKCTLEPTGIEAFPVFTSHANPCFSPGNINNQTIATMLGNLKMNQPWNTGNFINREEQSSLLSPTVVLFTPTIISTVNLVHRSCPYIACTAAFGWAWVRTDKSKLQLLDRHGDEKDVINTDFPYNDIAITPQSDVLFTDFKNRRIASASKTATSWRIETLFSTRNEPSGICCLRDGDIVVTYSCTEYGVIQYNKEGGIVHKYDESLFSRPRKVALNKFNYDLYVCDIGSHKVLAFKKDHNFRYEYKGSRTALIQPVDVCSDANGCVLITDTRNNKIHILDMDGVFLQDLRIPELNIPRYIDVDSERNLWIEEFERQFKIIKYN